MQQTTGSESAPTPATGVSAKRPAPAGNRSTSDSRVDDVPAEVGVASPRRGAMEASKPAARSRSTLRWWAAVAIGVIVSLPFAWLLSYAAALPYFLGLFFFVLFGLVIGAAMHRVASSGRPYGYTTLVAGTTVVVLVGWMMSVVTEGRGFSSDMAMKAGQSTRRRIPDIEAYRAAVAADVDRFLRERYPPGGSIGYVRWILTSGELEKGEIAGVDRTLRRGPRRGWWAVRVVLSLGLLAFGIGSQTLPLTSATEHAVRAIDERKV